MSTAPRPVDAASEDHGQLVGVDGGFLAEAVPIGIGGGLIIALAVIGAKVATGQIQKRCRKRR
ncbi:MAG TPA: hypothetical protein VGR32_06000 [Brevundimonas sp.]|uniref:hypothetical protein n=1 Tax=Brevundimonas sp. TaxID=1871086 RepID=UPI002DF01E7B|nr:hypothetical protein [Brevundimonas sp.]